MTDLAIVGSGRWAERYIEAIDSIKDCRIAYICSPHAKSKLGISAKFDTLSDYRKLAKIKEVDGIILATPAGSHYEIAKFFISNNKNLLIEKPLATSYHEAKILASLEKKSSSVSMVSDIYKYDSTASNFISESERVGRIFFVDCVSGKDYSFVPGRELSALWEWLPHELSVLSRLLESSPIAVSAWEFGPGNQERVVLVKLIYSNNIKVFVKVGWLFLSKTKTVLAYGDKGVLGVNFLNNELKFYAKNGEVKSRRLSKKESPLKKQLEEFVRRINKQELSDKDLAKGLEIVKVSHFAQKSIEQNGKLIEIK